MSKETDDGGKTCIHSTYDKCMYGALFNHMKNNTPREDGCTVPWVMDGLFLVYSGFSFIVDFLCSPFIYAKKSLRAKIN